MAKLDMAEVRRLMDRVEEVCDFLDGRQADDPAVRDNRKDRAAHLAEINRKLLYGAHLLDTAALEMRNQFHRFKGEEPPKIVS